MPGSVYAARTAVHNHRTITIDRNARKALLAALALQLTARFENLPHALGERDRDLLMGGVDFFAHLAPILDGLEFWGDGREAPAQAYTIPTSSFLEELVTDYAQQIRRGLDDDEKGRLAEIEQKGASTFEAGGEFYDSEETLHPHQQWLDWMVEKRQEIENDIDELVGCESIIAALSATDEAEDR